MAATCNYQLEQKDCCAINVMSSEHWNLASVQEFLRGDHAIGEFYIALRYDDESRMTRACYYFTDHRSAMEFKLRFG